MSWVRVDDRFWCHPKVIRAGVEAIGLWLLACCWASTQETDGRLPADVLETIPGYRKPLANRLVLAGLWDEIEGGFQIHDYLEFNPSAAEQQAKRAASAERMRRSRKRCAATDAQVAPQSRVSDSAPSRPDPGPARPLPQESTPAVAGGPKPPRTAKARPVQQALTKVGPSEAPTTPAWNAYATAFAERHGAAPPRSAKANVFLKQFLAQVPSDEAPEIARFYVFHTAAYYVAQMHPLALLAKDAPKLRTEWITGRKVNAEVARRNEQTEANPFYRMAQEIREQEERDADVIDAEVE